MLIQHPCIYLGADGARTTHLLVRDGRIVATGDEAAARATTSDEVLRPAGACLFPALCDAHIHMWGLGLRQGSVSLAAADCAEAVYQTLATHDLAGGPQGWVLGRDWDQHRWSGTPALDIARLDALFPSHPLVLRRVDGHALWVNSAALRRAGIAPDWDPGPNGRVARDDAGRPTGLLVDDAMNPVLEALGEPSIEEDLAVFRASAQMLRGYGCAAAHIAWMPLDRMPMLDALHADGALPLRLHLLLDGRDPALPAQLERGPRFDDWLNVAGVKFFADGALGSRGAHLLAGYPDGSRGLVLESSAHLEQRCRDLASRGWQVAIHAIGDAAAQSVLDAYAAIDPADRLRTRPRIEHCQMLVDDDVARFGELGVVASIQAIHLRSDAAWADEELTTTQLDELFRWRDLVGVAPALAGGSDYPIEDPNPWHGIATASTRRDRRGRVFRGAQKLTRIEALRSYTEGAAFASFRERDSGRLDPGFFADWIVLDRDPFAASDDEIWDMQVLETHVG